MLWQCTFAHCTRAHSRRHWLAAGYWRRKSATSEVKRYPAPGTLTIQTWSAGIRFNLAAQLHNVDVQAMNGAPVACPHTWPSNTCLLRIVSRLVMRTFKSAYFVKS